MKSILTKTIIFFCFASSLSFANGVIRTEDELKDKSDPTAKAAKEKVVLNKGAGETLRPNQYGYKGFGFPDKDREVDQKKQNNSGYDEVAIIKNVQRRLKARGYNIDKINGKLDSKTHNALTKFQSERGIGVTGRVNQNTLDALDITPIPEATERDQRYSE